MWSMSALVYWALLTSDDVIAACSHGSPVVPATSCLCVSMGVFIKWTWTSFKPGSSSWRLVAVIEFLASSVTCLTQFYCFPSWTTVITNLIRTQLLDCLIRPFLFCSICFLLYLWCRQLGHLEQFISLFGQT